MIGNAVPVNLAWELAKIIKSDLEKIEIPNEKIIKSRWKTVSKLIENPIEIE